MGQTAPGLVISLRADYGSTFTVVTAVSNLHGSASGFSERITIYSVRVTIFQALAVDARRVRNNVRGSVTPLCCVNDGP